MAMARIQVSERALLVGIVRILLCCRFWQWNSRGRRIVPNDGQARAVTELVDHDIHGRLRSALRIADEVLSGLSPLPCQAEPLVRGLVTHPQLDGALAFRESRRHEPSRPWRRGSSLRKSNLKLLVIEKHHVLHDVESSTE